MKTLHKYVMKCGQERSETYNNHRHSNA